MKFSAFLLKSGKISIQIFTVLVLLQSLAKAQSVTSDAGDYYPILASYSDQNNSSLSFLSNEWDDPEVWREKGREKLQELLAYDPNPAPLNPEYLDTVQEDGFTRYLVRYQTNANQKTEAFLLIPDQLQTPAPAVIAMHDHGGFYYYGKEKHHGSKDAPSILSEYKEGLYEGRNYGDELAKRGFIVLSPDAVYFGSQKIDPDKISPEKTREYYRQVSDNENNTIKAFNELAGRQEIAMNKTILAAGTTWLGMIVQGDIKSIDFLLTRPEVDPERIGVMGLSLGGLRTTYLFGLDSRIKTGVIAGFMSSYRHMLQSKVGRHTWMAYVPRQYQFLDLPDVASLNAPRPLVVMNAAQDQLFTKEGMEKAGNKLRTIYSKMGADDHFDERYYEAPHSMNIEMQEDAFNWFEKWLQ